MFKRINYEDMGCSRLPWYWGVAWRDLDTLTVIVMPVPVNWVVGWLRLAYWRLASGPRDKWEVALRKATAAARQKGYTEGYRDGLREIVQKKGC